MRNPERINRIVEKLRAAWLTHPDLRLTQLVESAAMSGQENDRVGTSVFYTEDDVTERGLDVINGL